MWIPPKRKRIPRIYHWTRRGQNRPCQDTGHLGLDSLQENQGCPMLPRFLQLLPRIYGRFQQNSQTTIFKDKKEMHRELRVGRQRTERIQRSKDKAHQGPSTGLQRPPRTNQDWNNDLKICLLWYTISTMLGWEMAASGIPIQDNGGHRMQRQYKREKVRNQYNLSQSIKT